MILTPSGLMRALALSVAGKIAQQAGISRSMVAVLSVSGGSMHAIIRAMFLLMLRVLPVVAESGGPGRDRTAVLNVFLSRLQTWLYLVRHGEPFRGLSGFW